MFHLLLYLTLNTILDILNLSNRHGLIIQYHLFDVKTGQRKSTGPFLTEGTFVVIMALAALGQFAFSSGFHPISSRNTNRR